MNRSRLDMNTARASTPTIALTLRPARPSAGRGWPAGPVPAGGRVNLAVCCEVAEVRRELSMGHALPVSPKSGLTVNRRALVRPVFGLTWYADCHGFRLRATAGVLHCPRARDRRREVGSPGRTGGLSGQRPFRRDGPAHRSAPRHDGRTAARAGRHGHPGTAPVL